MDTPSETGIRASREDNVSFCFKDKLKPPPSAPAPLESASPYPILRGAETNDRWLSLSLLLYFQIMRAP